MPKIGLVLPGNFTRLAGHHAFGHAWFEASCEGFPRPDYITGSSAGAIAAANIAHWNEAHFRKTEELLLKLRRSDFMGMNPRLKRSGIMTALASMALLAPTHRVKNPFIHYGLNTALASFVLTMEKRFAKAMMTSDDFDSFFVLDNLIRFLGENFDYEALFDSPVRVEVPTVDINRIQWRSVTNFKLEHRNPETFVNGVVDSIRIWGFFNPRLNEDGGYNVDAAVMSNVPIQFAMREGCDTIVVAYYDCAIEGPTERRFTNWIKSLQRCFDIVVSENSRKTLRGYINVNNDLDQLEKSRAATDELASFLGYYPKGTWLRLEKALTMAREAESSYSFTKKRKIKLVVVRTEPLPSTHFSDFDTDRTIETMNICYKAFRDVRGDIEKAVRA